MNLSVSFISRLLLWYLFSTYFNVYNKIVLSSFPFPWFLAMAQSVVGVCLVAPFYARVSALNMNAMGQLFDICWNLRFIAVISCLSNVSGTMAVGAGSIHLAQTIKAAEPMFTSVAYMYATGKVVSRMQWISFLVIVLGTLVASRFEVDFVWSSVIAGIVSNACAGIRSVLSKDLMQRNQSGNILNAKSFYLLLTLTSFFVLLPITIVVEGPRLLNQVKVLKSGGLDVSRSLVINVLVSGALFHLYNEFSFQTLDSLTNPISYAIANSFRRVAIIVLSVVILNAPWTLIGMFGSFISVVGVFLYSICK